MKRYCFHTALRVRPTKVNLPGDLFARIKYSIYSIILDMRGHTLMGDKFESSVLIVEIGISSGLLKNGILSYPMLTRRISLGQNMMPIKIG
jgi:hypothetical protein